MSDTGEHLMNDLSSLSLSRQHPESGVSDRATSRSDTTSGAIDDEAALDHVRSPETGPGSQTATITLAATILFWQ